MILSDTICALGEGALWHPEEEALYWVDIRGKRLYRHDGRRQQRWAFDLHISALGWIDTGRLLVSGEAGLFTFDTDTGAQEVVAEIEADRPEMRSNDGRADPWGGFWASSMRKDETGQEGAIYRFYKGEVVRLYERFAIPNAISFAPGGAYAYFCDTAAQVIRRVALDGEGWPAGDPVDFVDLRDEGLNPDGAVVDSQGNLWNAQYGAGRVACYAPDGAFMTAIGLPAGQVTCPAFGGRDLSMLYVTSAAHGAAENDRLGGATFAVPTGFKGQRAHRVVV